MAVALLVYSMKCKHSHEILRFLESDSQFKQMIQLHDINALGIPPRYAQQIQRVPTMLTTNGKILVGQEIRSWLESLLPNTLSNFTIKSSNFASFDGNEETDDMFSLDQYGQSLQPAITKELQDKISRPVTQGTYNAD
jgi:hypothetical protein